MSNYELLENAKIPVKMWSKGVVIEEEARKQIANVANLPIIHSHVAIMPDAHFGNGSCVGSVIPTIKAIIPSTVGVDLGCGVAAVKTSLTATDLPDSLAALRSVMEQAIPHGGPGGAGSPGAWKDTPGSVEYLWKHALQARFENICKKHPYLEKSNTHCHLGTLGSGNHMVSLALDETNSVWLMIHSGSRGVGNAIGTHFIALAKKDMQDQLGNLPDQNLAYFTEGAQHFEDYVEAVSWAQDFAANNRAYMMVSAISALRKIITKPFTANEREVNCHHNYVQKEYHFGADVYVTRKGAVSARLGEAGVILGSMGTKSYVVAGKGNIDSFHTCSHGAGRAMSRTAARKKFTVEDLAQQTLGVECRKDDGVLDELPQAYKDLDSVMEAQKDLVSITHTLKEIMVIKG